MLRSGYDPVMSTLEVGRTDDGVCWLWLNRPAVRNALDDTILAELQEALAHLAQDDEVRAVVIGGRGGSFSAGLDVRWMADRGLDELAKGLPLLGGVFRSFEAFPKPLIAGIDGPAVGAGMLLAMAADFRIATHRARLGAPEVKLGIFPSLGFIPLLERLVGTAAAKQLVLLGEHWDGPTALRHGLVHELVEQDRFEARLAELAGALAALPAMALRSAKEAFAVAGRSDFDTWEEKQFAACWASPERLPAMMAFFTRRG